MRYVSTTARIRKRWIRSARCGPAGSASRVIQPKGHDGERNQERQLREMEDRVVEPTVDEAAARFGLEGGRPADAASWRVCEGERCRELESGEARARDRDQEEPAPAATAREERDRDQRVDEGQ